MKPAGQTIAICLIFAISSLQPAAAYLGPGGVISGFGAILALIVTLLVAILGFLWFPIKRALSRRKNTSEDMAETPDSNTNEKNESRHGDASG